MAASVPAPRHLLGGRMWAVGWRPLTAPSRPEEPSSLLGPVPGSAGEARQQGRREAHEPKPTGRPASTSGAFLHQNKPGRPRPPLGPCHGILERTEAGPRPAPARGSHGGARVVPSKPERGVRCCPRVPLCKPGPSSSDRDLGTDQGGPQTWVQSSTRQKTGSLPPFLPARAEETAPHSATDSGSRGCAHVHGPVYCGAGTGALISCRTGPGAWPAGRATRQAELGATPHGPHSRVLGCLRGAWWVCPSRNRLSKAPASGTRGGPEQRLQVSAGP